MGRPTNSPYEIEFCEESKRYKIKNSRSGGVLFSSKSLSSAENFFDYMVHFPISKRIKDE